MAQTRARVWALVVGSLNNKNPGARGERATEHVTVWQRAV